MSDDHAKVDPPQTAAQAVALLRRMADARRQYLPMGFAPPTITDLIDKRYSQVWYEVTFFRAAADLIETGDIAGAPSWLWEQMADETRQDQELALAEHRCEYREALEEIDHLGPNDFIPHQPGVTRGFLKPDLTEAMKRVVSIVNGALHGTDEYGKKLETADQSS